MNEQDDPRFADFKFPCAGFVVEHKDEGPPEIRMVRLIEYSLSGPECSIKTILFRRLNDDGSLGQRTRCSVEMIFVSVEEATEEIRKEMEEGVLNLKEQLEIQTLEIAQQLQACKDWLRANPRPKHPNET